MVTTQRSLTKWLKRRHSLLAVQIDLGVDYCPAYRAPASITDVLATRLTAGVHAWSQQIATLCGTLTTRHWRLRLDDWRRLICQQNTIYWVLTNTDRLLYSLLISNSNPRAIVACIIRPYTQCVSLKDRCATIKWRILTFSIFSIRMSSNFALNSHLIS